MESLGGRIPLCVGMGQAKNPAEWGLDDGIEIQAAQDTVSTKF